MKKRGDLGIKIFIIVLVIALILILSILFLNIFLTKNNISIAGFPSLKFFLFPATITAVDDCQIISSPGKYVLEHDITPTGFACINITSPDVELDCQGYWITDPTHAGNGIYSNSLNTTIKNCNLQLAFPQVSTPENFYAAIHLHNGAGNSKLVNNYVKDTFRGIWIQGNASEDNTRTDNVYLENNTVTGSQQYAILLVGTSNNILINNSISNSVSYGLAIQKQGNNNKVLGHNSTNDNTAILLRTARGNYLEDLNIYESTRVDIWITSYEDGGSFDNIFKNINITPTGVYPTGESVNVDGAPSEANWCYNNSFVNSNQDYIYERVPGGSLYRKYSYTAVVKDLSGNPIENAEVGFYNSTDLLYSVKTDAYGQVFIDLPEYVKIANLPYGTRTFDTIYFENLTIRAYKSESEQNYTINVSYDKIRNDVFTLDPKDTIPPVEIKTETPSSSSSGSSSGTYSCSENWTCNDWTDCRDSVQTRTCTDINYCRTNKTKPITQKSCIENKLQLIEKPEPIVLSPKKENNPNFHCYLLAISIIILYLIMHLNRKYLQKNKFLLIILVILLIALAAWLMLSCIFIAFIEILIILVLHLILTREKKEKKQVKNKR